MLPSHPEPRMRQLRACMVTSRQRMKLGRLTRSKDDWAVLQALNDATAGDIPAVRKLARQLRKSGKGLEEALAAVKHRPYARCGPLHMAAWAGRLEMCKFLIEDLRLNVNAPSDDGTTPLSFAVDGCGSTSVISILLDHGAKPNKANRNGITPLHFATMTGTHNNSETAKLWAANTRDTYEIAELLLSRGAYVDPICQQGTPLHIAAKSGNVRMLELLLRHQANPNTVVYLFYTPLSYAVCASSLKCVELLIKAGADVNAGRPVTTPLTIAAAHGFTGCIKCLLEAGADANITDEVPLANANDGCDLSAKKSGCALKEQEGAAFEENDGFALKIQGDAAFEGNNYADALALYTKAMEIDPDDSTLYAKRSLCWLHTSEEDKALVDAYTYRTMKMDPSNSCYEQVAALILVEEYARACRVLVLALKLDLRSDDLD
uniref:Uncharacterized protein n=1 Tax=Avena sativa TaxID=4498 RepID=A0ACD5UVQ6_AVESA